MENKTEFALHFEAKGSGTPLLLIHGFPLSSRMWAGQMEALSSQAQVLAPDLPGFGDSPLSDTVYTVERYAEDCAAVLDALDLLEPVAVGGLSMGGYIALAFARLFPERVGALLLLSTRAGADSAESKANRDKAITGVKEHGASAVTEAMLPKLLAPANYAGQPAMAAEARELMRTASPDGIVAALSAMRDRPDATGQLGNLGVPTLIVHGKDDQLIPSSEAEAMAAAIRGSQLHLIAQAGHLPNLEQPEEFNHILSKFLTEIS
ncbi:MAG TPA: alpha/beta fold hydrolase [Anaerolineales bacterium]